MNRRDAERRITDMFKRYASATSRQARGLIPPSLSLGKLYEAHVLGLVAERLSVSEGLVLVLSQGRYLALKSAPSPINSLYPSIEVHRNGRHEANLWTDVQFTALSCAMQRRTATASFGDYHELDIIVADLGAHSRPLPEEIWLGVECKNTGYGPSLLREILGIRRELSLLQDAQATKFSTWPRSQVPANPPSCLLVYSTDPDVLRYSAPGSTFGIDFFHEAL